MISVCNDKEKGALEQKLLLINRQWKEMIENFDNAQHEESIRKKRDEFYSVRTNILETLEKIHREIQETLPCTIKALKEQEDRLYVR